jgi:transcriptional regulator with XRE-family HTH domain
MLSDNIKWLVKANGYTQRELALRAGITEAALSRYVAGSHEPPANNLKNLAIALGVSVDELIADVVPNSGEGYVLCVDGVSGYFPNEFIAEAIRHYVYERKLVPTDEVVSDLYDVIEWLEEHGRNTNTTGIIAICRNAIDVILTLRSFGTVGEASASSAETVARQILSEIREAYERYGGAYGMLQKINELEQRLGVIDCTKCRHFVGCESCRTGQVCGEFERIEN